MPTVLDDFGEAVVANFDTWTETRLCNTSKNLKIFLKDKSEAEHVKAVRQIAAIDAELLKRKVAQRSQPGTSGAWLNTAKSNQQEYNATNQAQPPSGSYQSRPAPAAPRRADSRDYSALKQGTQTVGPEKKRRALLEKSGMNRPAQSSLGHHLKPSTSGRNPAHEGQFCINCRNALHPTNQHQLDMPLCSTCAAVQSELLNDATHRNGQGGVAFNGCIPVLADKSVKTSNFYSRPVSTRASGSAPLVPTQVEQADTAPQPSRKRAKKEPPAKAKSETIEILSDEEPTPHRQSGLDPTRVPETADRGTRTSQRMTRSSTLSAGSTQTQFEGLRAVFPPQGGKGSVEVLPADLARLDEDEFLNDTIIDFYLKHIFERLPEDKKEQVQLFNSFFYTKIAAKSPARSGSSDGSTSKAQRNFESVKRWTQNIDIFSKEFIIVPIHDHLHWSLLIVCHPGALLPDSTCSPCMIHLDSLSGCHSLPTIGKAMRDYLQHEWDRKEANPGRRFQFTTGTIPAQRVPNVPQQDNYCDCGLFLLTYAEYFLPWAPAHVDVKTMTSLKDTHSYPLFFSRDWFEPRNASSMRGYLRNLILTLFMEQLPEAQRESSHGLALATAEVDEYTKLPPSQKYKDPLAYMAEAMRRQEVLQKEAHEAAQRKMEKQREKEREQEGKQAERRNSHQPSQRELLAAAAEARRAGSASQEVVPDSQEDIQIDLDDADPVEGDRQQQEQPASGPAPAPRQVADIADSPMPVRTTRLSGRTAGPSANVTDLTDDTYSPGPCDPPSGSLVPYERSPSGSPSPIPAWVTQPGSPAPSHQPHTQPPDSPNPGSSPPPPTASRRKATHPSRHRHSAAALPPCLAASPSSQDSLDDDEPASANPLVRRVLYRDHLPSTLHNLPSHPMDAVLYAGLDQHAEPSEGPTSHRGAPDTGNAANQARRGSPSAPPAEEGTSPSERLQCLWAIMEDGAPAPAPPQSPVNLLDHHAMQQRQRRSTGAKGRPGQLANGMDARAGQQLPQREEAMPGLALDSQEGDDAAAAQSTVTLDSSTDGSLEKGDAEPGPVSASDLPSKFVRQAIIDTRKDLHQRRFARKLQTFPDFESDKMDTKTQSVLVNTSDVEGQSVRITLDLGD